MSGLPSVYDYPSPEFLERTTERPACANRDPNLFFPATGQGSLLAKSICAGCPLRADCLEWALFTDVHGIWGGLTHAERGRLRRGRGLASYRVSTEPRSYNAMARH